MGNVYAYRGRLTPALIVLALVALVIVALGMVAAPAKATSDSFTLCGSCHGMSATHSNPNHSSVACGTCHVAGSGAAGLRPSACASCHGAANILAKTKSDGTPAHPASTCGAAGCHAAPSPSPSPSAPATTTIAAAKVAPTTVKVGKKATISGTARSCRFPCGREGRLQGRAQGRHQVDQDEDGFGHRERHRRVQVDLQGHQEGRAPRDDVYRQDETYTAKKVVESFKVK